jgi:hypothetical protein
MAAGPQKSGGQGDSQKGPVVRPASSSAGAQNVKGGAAPVAVGPKGGPRDQKSGGKGG